MRKVTFQGWKNCIELKSGEFKLIVTTEIGPRIIAAFYGKSKNLFYVDPELAGKKGGPGWVNYGGHRFWLSPETKERTYEPDNGEGPMRVTKRDDGGYDFATPMNPINGIAKVLTVIPGDDGTFQIHHSLRNEGVWTVEVAPWALSVMAPGGIAIVPQNQNAAALLPTSFYAVWPYTKMNDPRITWGEKFLLVRQDANAETPLKVGFNCQDGWISYINNGIVFIKQFGYDEEACYPDNGCSVEVYTNKHMLEAETLGALVELAPGEETTHIELWSAFEGPEEPVLTEDDVEGIFVFDDDCGCCDDDCGCGDDDCGCQEEEEEMHCCCHDGECVCEEEVEVKEEKPAKKASTRKSAAKKTAKK